MTNERHNILITGSAGFIFSNFIRSALYDKKPWTITGVDRFSCSADLNGVFVHKQSINHISDITDEHLFSRIVEFSQPDVIIHAAAFTSVDEALHSPDSYVKNNVLGTQSALSAAHKHKIKKFVYINTDEIYGQLSSESDPSWTEDSPLAPRNIYSASKAAGEHLVKAYGETYGLNYNIVRMSNNYGQRQTPNKLIPRIIQSIFNDEKIRLYGKGNQMRDWLHTRDTYSAISTILDKGKPNETYNIGANQEFSNLEVVQLVCKAMKQEMRLDFVEDRPGHDFRYSLDSTKIRNLGWEPQIKFRDGIEDTVNWFMANKYWLKDKK